MNHTSEEQLVLHYYREADDDAGVEKHLSECDSCRASFREIQQALAGVNSVPVPELPQEYGSLVWKRIQPHLAVRPRAGRLGVAGVPRWALAAAAVALLVAAFLVGRYWPRPETPEAQPLASAEVGKRVFLAAAAEHLERSQIVLMDLKHAGGTDEADISADQAAARELLESNRIYRQAAERAGEPGLANVLDDLELTLLEVVHSPTRMGTTDLDRLQREIESGGILFKLRVTASRIRERQTEAARERGRRST